MITKGFVSFSRCSIFVHCSILANELGIGNFKVHVIIA